jgi:hypothetical protein
MSPEQPKHRDDLADAFAAIAIIAIVVAAAVLWVSTRG